MTEGSNFKSGYKSNYKNSEFNKPQVDYKTLHEMYLKYADKKEEPVEEKHEEPPKKTYDPKSLVSVKSIELGNNLRYQEFIEPGGEKVYDIRSYFQNYPTKRGVRLRRNQIDMIKRLFD